MKKKYIIIIILLMSIISVIFLVNKDMSTKNSNTNNLTVGIENNPVYDTFTIKINDINQVLNQNINGYIYFGRDTCSDCLKLNYIFKKESLINNGLKIYKFDTDTWRNNENFKDILSKYNVTSVPTLIKVHENKVEKFLTIDFDGKGENEVEKELKKFFQDK